MSISLYIHIPFCKSKCPYCSFVSFDGMKEAIGPYLEALKKEAAFYKGMRVSTIYIGGGTPTCLDEAELEFLFEMIRYNFKTDHLSEWTVEANPATFDLSKAIFLCRHGATRVSLGAQSFQDKFLKFLGRPYAGCEVVKAYEDLREAGFKNLSVDLMYGLVSQNREELAADVRGALALKSEHISLYGLAVSSDTVFYRDGIKPLDDDRQADYYRWICGWLAEGGLTQYEVSNFSKEGFESRHNLNYWQGGEYIGLGVSAHSHLEGRRFWNVSDLSRYCALAQEGILPQAGSEVLSTKEKFLETVLVGLRMTQGIDIEELKSSFGVGLDVQKIDLIDGLIREGLLKREAGRLKATPRGILVLDEVCVKII